MSQQHLRFSYHVGGSVPPESQTYVRRQADDDLLQGLLAGEFCYVFNARQMGKSSLRVQVMAQLREAGVLPGALDLTAIGTQQVNVEQWYGAIAAILSKQFQLKTNLRQWWRDHLDFPPSARLGNFIEEVLLPETEAPLVILIDEIDSILALKFATDDFFAIIRTCYNRRAEISDYRRLSFALFGVATPGELIGDKNRTPFNVGQGISLQGFKAHEVMPLVEGLAPVFPHPHQGLERILAWTGGQPFLTQKLCKLVVKLYQDYPVSRLKTPTDIQNYIDDCVEQKIICNWEAQDEPEHLKTIRDRLLYDEQKVGQLLTLYRQIWQAELSGIGYVQAHESPIQTELILSGVAEKRQGYLRVKNRIYQRVFNQDWVDKQLNDLRPYASSLNAWVDSNYQDESRLLRGQALQEALDWTQQKGLGDLDYRYLSASQDLEQREIQEKLERARLAEAEARLEIERESGRRQRRLLAGLTVALVGAIALGIGTFRAYQQTAVSEINAMMAASKGSFASNQQLDALIQALQARQNLQNIRFIPRNIRQQLADNTQETLQQVLYGNRQFNRITAHTEMALGLDFSPDGQWIATSGIDETTKIWTRDGTLKHTLTYGGITRNVTFSPDSQYLATANFDSDIYIWSVDGTLQQKLKGHDEEVWDVAWSPDGQTLVSVGRDKTVRLWSVNGDSRQVLEGHEAFLRTVDFHPNGDEFASMSVDGTINIWSTDGTLLRTFTDVSAPGMAIAYSPDGDLLVAGYGDHQVRLWHRERGLLETLSGHEAEVATVAFSPDGQQFASAGVDRELKLWSRQGSLLTTLKGHESHLRGIAFSPEGTELGSVGEDGVLHLWQVKTPFRQLLPGHGDVVWRGDYAPRSSPLYPHLATVSGMDIRLWDDEGVLVEDWVHISPRRLYSLALHPHEPILVAGNSRGEIFQVNRAEKSVQSWQTDGPAILALAYSPDGRWLLVSDGTSLRVWAQTPAGESILYHTFDGHQEQVWDLAFSPDGSYLVSGSLDGVLNLWEIESDPGQDSSPFRTGPSRSLTVENGAIWGIAICPNSERIAVATREGWLSLWSREGELLKQIQVAEDEGLTRLDWSPDGQLLAVGRVDSRIDLYRIGAGVEVELLTRLVGHESEVTTVAFSPNGDFVMSGGQDRLGIRWHLETILSVDLMQVGCDRIRDYLRQGTRKYLRREVCGH